MALAAFDSFCRGAEKGVFPGLDDRDDLWQVLLLLAARKASRLRRDERRQKRGGGRVQTATDLAGPEAEDDPLAEVIGTEPTPDFAAEMAEECRRLLDRLGDGELRRIAVARMEGYSVAEIAGRLGRAPRTVERKIAEIRKTWVEEEPL